jgi:hypothetical protein
MKDVSNEIAAKYSGNMTNPTGLLIQREEKRDGRPGWEWWLTYLKQIKFIEDNF